MTRFYTVDESKFYFNNARDAIDAVSAFEEQTAQAWEYHITSIGDDIYTVAANRIDDGQPRTRGYLGYVHISEPA
jgi:hypothetical protein